MVVVMSLLVLITSITSSVPFGCITMDLMWNDIVVCLSQC